MSDKIKLENGAPWIIIMGDGGAGKTRLSAAGGGYCINTEGDGASTAYPPERIFTLNYGEQMFDDMLLSVKMIATNVKKKGRNFTFKIQKEEIETPYVVVDTIDTCQQVLVDRLLSQKKRPGWASGKIWAPRMEMQDWGTILNIQQPLITEARKSNIPFVWVTHAKPLMPEYSGWGDNKRLTQQGKLEMALQGAFRGRLFNQASVVVYLTAGEGGKRVLYTQPTVELDIKYECKDRHSIFRTDKGAIMQKIEIPGDKDGFPTRDVVSWVLDRFDY